MGGVSSPGGDGGLNVELNLVPFIDLLSSLVLFLLLSAVWIQVASLQAGVETKGARAISSSATPPKRLTIHLTAKGYELDWPGTPGRFPSSLAKKAGEFEAAALTQLIRKAAELKAIESGAIAAEESVPYGAVIEALDAVKSGGVSTVAISTN